MSRPTLYNEVMADAICEEIASGRSLLKICAEKTFPGETTVYRWLDSNEQFREKYARARELQAEHYAQEIIDLADTPVIAEKRTIKADGSEELVIGDAVDRTRVQIDARKWYASKVAPKKYGDKLDLNHNGNIGVQLINDIPRPARD